MMIYCGPDRWRQCPSRLARHTHHPFDDTRATRGLWWFGANHGPVPMQITQTILPVRFPIVARRAFCINILLGPMNPSAIKSYLLILHQLNQARRVMPMQMLADNMVNLEGPAPS